MAALIKPVDRFQDWINLIVAALLFASPWLLGYTGIVPASWNAWICGAVLAALAVAALAWFAEWEEWISIALGAWLVVAPWVLGFNVVVAAMRSHVILGLVIIAFAGWSAWSARHGGTHAAA